MTDPPVVVTVAPTGPLTTREQQPQVPLTPVEIGVAVAEAAEAGAAVAHIHARDEDGKPTADPAVYAAIAAEIRARCEIVVQASTGVGLSVSCEERIEILRGEEVDVTMATLNPASMTFGVGFEDIVYIRRGELAESNAQFVRRAAALIRAAGRVPEAPDDVRRRLETR